MNVKTKKNRVVALVLSLLVALAFMPAMVSAATSTGLEYASSSGTPNKPVTTQVGAEKGGYIAAKATGEALETDKVTCVSADEEIATIIDQNKTDKNGYWKFDVIGHKAGSTTVTVTAVDNPENTAVIPVTVTAPDGVYIDFESGGPITTAVGAAKGGLITAKAVVPEGMDDKVVCVSSDESIAAVVDQNKKNKNGYWKFDVNGVANGSTTVIVSSVLDPEVQEVVNVQVVEDLVTVIQGDKTTAFSIDEFNALPTETLAAWSGRNHSFTYKSYGEAVGPKLITVLNAAGVETGELEDDQLIRLTPSDGTTYQGTFTVKQLLRDKRYYFPNSADLVEGNVATEAQLADAVRIPTILCSMDNSDGRLVFGQVYPNERSNSVSIKNMTTGGTIEILDETAEKLGMDVTANIASGSIIKPGTEIKLNSPSLLSTDIYYTLDGSVPDEYTSALYNYRTKEMSDEPDGGLKNATIKAPATEGTFTIKVVQFAYGKKNSNVKTFTYKVAEVKKNATYKVNSQSYKVTKVATAKAKGTVTFTKSKNAKTVTVPNTVKLKDGKIYNVNVVAAKAFTPTKVRTVNIGANVATLKAYALKGSKATKVVLKTKKLKKTTVKKSLSGSKVKYVVVKVGTKAANKTYVTKYKKFFTKANAGKKVTVK